MGSDSTRRVSATIPGGGSSNFAPTPVDDCFDSGLTPIPLCSCDDLDMMRTELSASFALQNDISFYACPEYREGAGWEPIGTAGDPFTGTFDGQGFTIDGLYINRSTTNDVSFFGRFNAVNISHLNLINSYVQGQDYIGTLLSQNTWSVASHLAGGIAGHVDSGFSFSYNVVMADIYGGDEVGGFSGSYASHGLYDSVFIGNIYGNDYVGGAGGHEGNSRFENITIIANITGNDYVGGFSGSVDTIRLINSSFVGNVGGVNNVGGATGEYWGSTTDLTERVLDSSIDAFITGSSNIGGVIGIKTGDPISTFGPNFEW